MDLKIKLLNRYAQLPTRADAGSAGLDLRALILADGDTTYDIVYPHSSKIIGTGIAIELPEGYEGQIRSRSGLAAKNEIAVLNSPGTIDSSFRGELKVILINHSDKNFTIVSGDRIAQLVIAPVIYPVIQVVDELSATDRGEGGLGSTGVK